MKLYEFVRSTVLIALLIGFGATVTLADILDIVEEGETTTSSISLGYRGISESGAPARALEYSSLESSPLFNVGLAANREAYFLETGFNYLNENEYSGEARLITKKLGQLSLRTDRFFHNLDHIPYYPDAAGSRDPGVITATDNTESERTFYSDLDQDEVYGIRLDIKEAKFKVKFPSYPAHLNFSYWRYEKHGDKQLRFTDENCATSCHMQSTTRSVDRVTEEFRGEVDAHAGFIDIALEALFRTFRDKEPIQRNDFDGHFRGRDVSGNPIEHSEDPDSKLTEFTIKANTAPSGGLVGSASFTVGERENQSNLTSITPVNASTDYYKTAADVTYTPSQFWTFNLRYRLLDMDSDNSNQLSAYGTSNTNPLDVRESMDITRAWYEMIVNYRPSNRLTLKGELRREDIDRSNTGPEEEHTSSASDPVAINSNWQLPDNETVTSAKLGFHSRMLEKSALKLSGWVEFQHSDDPAYGVSLEDSQELFLSGRYTPSPYWGIMANMNLLKQENTDNDVHGHSLDREKLQNNVSFGGWFIPGEGLSFDLNYGYLNTSTEHDLLFGSATGYAIEDENVDYEQTVQTVTLGMNWQPREDLSCRIEGYHIRSEADFSTVFPTATYTYNPRGPFDATASSTGIGEISALDIRQNGLRGRTNWQIDDEWSCSAEVTYDDYDDKNNNYYDGTVETAMISFTRTW